LVPGPEEDVVLVGVSGCVEDEEREGEYFLVESGDVFHFS
jgi:hypothetical protein